MRIAVIIPALNEAQFIQQTLFNLQAWRQKGHQVLLVDGGSTDETLTLAEPLVDELLVSEPGRALQMNMGAEHADADILLFLHADTLISENADQHIIASIAQGNDWGRFNVAFSSGRLVFRIIAFFINLRSCLSSIATGDQAIYVDKLLFDRVGRFPPLPLMEDVQLSINLKRKQRACCLQQTVITSSRRWEKNGIYKTILLMWSIRLGYFIGIPTEKLKLWYK